MMNLKFILPVVAVSTLLLSCKKDKTNPVPETVYDNYSSMKVGNYWIYQRFNIDASGNETATNLYDSCYIEKDTMINSKKYFKYVNSEGFVHGTPGDAEYLRDSLHYIVDSYGNIRFSSQDFTSKLKESFQIEAADTVVRYSMKMTDKDAVVSTPWGNFVTSNSQLEVYVYPNYSSTVNPRYKNIRYAKNVGIVTKMLDFYFASPNYTELRLVNYHVQ